MTIFKRHLSVLTDIVNRLVAPSSLVKVCNVVCYIRDWPKMKTVIFNALLTCIFTPKKNSSNIKS